MEFYGVKDIMQITGCSKSYSYQIIKELLEDLKEEYPDAITIRGKVPKWYFDKKLRTKE